MCGFVLSVNDPSKSLESALFDLRHRGPDSLGTLNIGPINSGFVRLSIVDPQLRSDQPMKDKSGRFAILFNGEIYNFKDLKKYLTSQGLSFVTESDTEVLLTGLILEGKSFLQKVNGIYAFSLCNLLTGEIHIARDPLGVKPLYFSINNKKSYVCSELRPLAKLLNKSIDIDGLLSYGSFGYVNSHSIFKEIEELPPNTFVSILDGNIISKSPIIHFSYGGDCKANFDEISNLINASMDEQIPDVPFGIMYSGGLDSTLILDKCIKEDRPPNVYSVVINDLSMSEEKWQDQGLAALGINSNNVTKIVMDSDKLGIEFIKKINQNLDYPIFHPNFIGSMLLSSEAKNNGLKVLLSGEGADEVFRGYKWFFNGALPDEYMEYVPYRSLLNIFNSKELVINKYAQLSKLEIFQKYYIRRWLLRQDMTGMANSIEIRVPFLSLPLVNYMNSLNEESFQDINYAKWPIKKILKAKFSDEFINRKKIGFDLPLNLWITKEHIQYIIEENKGLIDTKAFLKVMNDLNGTYTKNRLIFSLVSILTWLDSFE